jgi:predicted nucleic-acid-binding Zn-ribbon protein
MNTLYSTEAIEFLGEMNDTANEVQDNRFAVINEKHYDYTEYSFIDDEGNLYSTNQVITVYSAGELYSLKCAYGDNAILQEIEAVYIFDDEQEKANRFFVDLIAERLKTM